MRVKKISNTECEVKFYGDIGFWFTDGKTISDLVDDLESQGYKKITFRLHCYGGSVFEGNLIGNVLASSKSEINIIIDGIAASMGCMILPYVPESRVSIADNAMGMVHRPTNSVGGNADDHESAAKLLRDIENNFIDVLHSRTKISKEDIKKMWLDGTDHWLSADEMVKYKLAGKKVKKIANIADLDSQRLIEMGEKGAYDLFVAKLDNNNNFNTIMDKKSIITAFGLTGVTENSTDAEILAALQAKYKKQEDRITELENKSKEQTKNAITKAIDKAIEETRIVIAENVKREDVVAPFLKIGLDSGLETLETILSSLPTKTKTGETNTSIYGMIHTATTQTTTVAKDWKWYQKNDPRALEALQKTNPTEFNAIYKKEFGVDAPKD